MLHLIDFGPIGDFFVILLIQNLQSPFLKLWNDSFLLKVHFNLVFKLIKSEGFLEQAIFALLFLGAVIINICFYLSCLFYYLCFFRSSNHTPTLALHYSSKGKVVVL
ncbi:MAG: hypothetical protein A3J47_00235 [Candidatus Yanofskybacteria bacterium RIFCSPHIGHO2_02_FULL_43_22]|uniref:Uncharacterized protein n=1 Tax=Candidatus Yanofskybacteria bacterium RIFCSPHIGHO2_02_FULL_43_22 TaxID=1802681 RepID=A0A1F8FR95_9BACT|nr:MAG: hypothetical protein A3J47_00235 [Candidatus Yanofskybacteria bacterium RIFCSPHIGHO2_02_FULL_43_22]